MRKTSMPDNCAEWRGLFSPYAFSPSSLSHPKCQVYSSGHKRNSDTLQAPKIANMPGSTPCHTCSQPEAPGMGAEDVIWGRPWLGQEGRLPSAAENGRLPPGLRAASFLGLLALRCSKTETQTLPSVSPSRYATGSHLNVALAHPPGMCLVAPLGMWLCGFLLSPSHRPQREQEPASVPAQVPAPHLLWLPAPLQPETTPILLISFFFFPTLCSLKIAKLEAGPCFPPVLFVKWLEP